MNQGQLSVKEFFENLNSTTMHLVDAFYDEDIVFCDPMVEIRGRRDMKAYYARLYKNVESISWIFSDEIKEGDRLTLTWRMILKAKNFNKNRPVHLDGISVIKFGGAKGKAIYHRDYFDMGAFVYETIPILGSVIRFIKKAMHGKDTNTC